MLYITLRRPLQIYWLSLKLNHWDFCSKWVMWCSRLCDSLSALSSAIIICVSHFTSLKSHNL